MKVDERLLYWYRGTDADDFIVEDISFGLEQISDSSYSLILSTSGDRHLVCRFKEVQESKVRLELELVPKQAFIKIEIEYLTEQFFNRLKKQGLPILRGISWRQLQSRGLAGQYNVREQ